MKYFTILILTLVGIFSFCHVLLTDDLNPIAYYWLFASLIFIITTLPYYAIRVFLKLPKVSIENESIRIKDIFGTKAFSLNEVKLTRGYKNSLLDYIALQNKNQKSLISIKDLPTDQKESLLMLYNNPDNSNLSRLF